MGTGIGFQTLCALLVVLLKRLTTITNRLPFSLIVERLAKREWCQPRRSSPEGLGLTPGAFEIQSPIKEKVIIKPRVFLVLPATRFCAAGSGEDVERRHE